MFERFTDQSRRAVVLAHEEARRFNHDHIGTEHLLAGLRREDGGAAARALTSADITLDALRGRIEALVGRSQQAPSGHIPFTPRAKECLGLSLRAALQLGQDHIGTGHLLLGLLGKDDCVAVQVLGELGADLRQLRARVMMEIEDQPETPADSARLRPRHTQVTDTVQEVQGLLDAIDDRLTAIERHLGILQPVPDEPRGYDEQITRVRREKEQAIESQDFHRAAALRDKEKELLAEQAHAAQTLADTGARPGTAENAERPDELARLSAETGRLRAEADHLRAETGRLQAETGRLRALLREHGIDPGGPGDTGAATG
jgi:ATP-dependent Clp protease ATP-binding subunit ClpA